MDSHSSDTPLPPASPNPPLPAHLPDHPQPNRNRSGTRLTAAALREQSARATYINATKSLGQGAIVPAVTALIRWQRAVAAAEAGDDGDDGAVQGRNEGEEERTRRPRRRSASEEEVRAPERVERRQEECSKTSADRAGRDRAKPTGTPGTDVERGEVETEAQTVPAKVS